MSPSRIVLENISGPAAASIGCAATEKKIKTPINVPTASGHSAGANEHHAAGRAIQSLNQEGSNPLNRPPIAFGLIHPRHRDGLLPTNDLPNFLFRARDQTHLA
jgi:hypothetical protein